MPAKNKTIRVKKADGTVVRVSLDEFKKTRLEAGGGGVDVESRKPEVGSREAVSTDKDWGEPVQILSITDALPDKPQKPKKKIGKSGEQLVRVNTSRELTLSTPVRDIFLDEAAALGKRTMDWDKEDHVSPLEDSFPGMEEGGHVGLDNHKDFVDKVLQSSGVFFPKSLSFRVRSLITSWKKGVRDDHQFSTGAKKSVETGGLGLEEAQVQKLLQAMYQNSAKERKVTRREGKSWRGKTDSVVQMSKPVLSKSNSDIENFVRPNARYTPKFNRQMTQTRVPSGTILHDVTPFQKKEEKKTTGPEEEMRNFTIVDFRRLSDDPNRSAELLIQKFDGWKQESLILFLEALNAWHDSPLYREYIDTIESSLNQNMKVRETLLRHGAEQHSLRETEFLALVQLNKHLNV